jgi:beta-galactosidase
MKRYSLLLVLMLSCTLAMARAPRRLIRVLMPFDNGWRFSLHATDASAATYDDSGWRQLNLPHDWAVEGAFSKDNPAGAGGGALPGGLGWYRKTFTLNESDATKHIFIDFDGVYMNSEVFINGHSLGVRPYGYISFEYDLTPYVNRQGKNVIAVKVDNSKQPNSRWYSGCGIYRHVYLAILSSIHVAHWGTQITTPQITAAAATACIKVSVKNETGKADKVEVRSDVFDAHGSKVATSSSPVTFAAGKSLTTVTQNVRIANPQLWSIDKPTLYTVKTSVTKGGETLDEYQSSFGVRTVRFDAKTGFYLNGVNMKLNGVCDHHDLGCLGAALNDVALHRQLKILKEMGCNAIRCSHNPPAPELLNLCDSMGLVVMDEAFDMWHRKKTAYDYGNFFDKWYKQDLTDLVVRDRNHPCVILWSIGNEILEQWNSASADTLTLEQANMVLNFGHKEIAAAKKNKMNVNSLLTKRLADIVRALDSTRPITAACNETRPENNLFQSGALDIIGFNYHNEDCVLAPKNFPGKPFFISESVSAVQTRGYYRMPSDSIVICPTRWDKPYVDSTYMCSAYDNCHVPWGSTHEATWDIVKHHPFISGQFIWTGFDYLGEPTPYSFPARSSYFGIVDLAGFPKDSYYMYQSEWTTKPVLHLFPHWNWKEGQTIDMWAYYNNADEVELFINGKSQGVRHKTEHCYHAEWHCTFEPGTVKAVSRKGGKVVLEQTIHTAGAAYTVRLTPDKKQISADGRDMCFVTVEVVDKDGNLCPNAENLIHFQVNGSAFIAGVDNGCETSMESFKAPQRKAFFGKCLVVLQSNAFPGKIELTAQSDGLQTSSMTIEEH